MIQVLILLSLKMWLVLTLVQLNSQLTVSVINLLFIYLVQQVIITNEIVFC